MTQTQAQTQAQREPREEAVLAFKRHILTASQDFASEPMADMYRVGLLGRMLDRYDALRAQGMGEITSVNRVVFEFGDIPRQMREAGFTQTEPADDDVSLSRWPQMSEADVDRYTQESDAYLHRTAMGSALCSACVAPLMVGAAFTTLWGIDMPSLVGLMGMFGMIGMGVYSCATAAKPRDQKRVKSGHFSLGARTRRKLEQLREEVEQRARRRRGKGVAMLVMCVMPLLLGAALDSLWLNDFAPVMGLALMFAMIGAGVYELVMADGEKKTMKRLLESDEEEPSGRSKGRRQ